MSDALDLDLLTSWRSPQSAPDYGRRLERQRVRVVGRSRSYRRGQVIELDEERAEAAVRRGWATWA